MRLGLHSLRRRFARAATVGIDDAACAPAAPATPRQDVAPRLQDLARELGDGEPCPAPLLLAFQAEIDERRRRTDTATGPTSPRTSDLLVRRAGLPDWWAAGDNLLLAAPTAKTPDFKLHPMKSLPNGIVVVLGARVVFNHFNLGGQGARVVIGDDVYGAAAALSCMDASTVLIGEATTATNWATLDAYNGGIIVAGEDGMWAHGVSLMTDDTHAIRDLATGKRLNVHGGRIVIERHVWLGENARVFGGARVGHDCVVGAGAMVKNAAIADHSVCVGVPARVVRSGITWSREDLP